MIGNRSLVIGSLTVRLSKLEPPKNLQKYLTTIFKLRSHNEQLRTLKELTEDVAFFQTFPSYLRCLQ